MIGYIYKTNKVHVYIGEVLPVSKDDKSILSLEETKQFAKENNLELECSFFDEMANKICEEFNRR